MATPFADFMTNNGAAVEAFVRGVERFVRQAREQSRKWDETALRGIAGRNATQSESASEALREAAVRLCDGMPPTDGYAETAASVSRKGGLVTEVFDGMTERLSPSRAAATDALTGEGRTEGLASDGNAALGGYGLTAADTAAQTMPTAAPYAPAPYIGTATGGNDAGLHIQIDRMEVRSDEDVARIARELYLLTERRRRGAGEE